ncbi:hypothetical protein ACWEP3_32615, partial [Streptomyces albidoflavus]
MHRTRTAAALLATVAVTALSGCVTVDRPPGTGSPTGRSPATAPTSAGEHAEPQIERSPARESLRRVGEEPTGTATRPPRPRLVVVDGVRDLPAHAEGEAQRCHV